MTLWDDVPTLLTKLRHSFITGDETGLSEIVITDDTVRRDEWNIKENCLVYNRRTRNQALSVSPDIYPETDYGDRRHRRRSQTDERLEKLKREKLASSTEHVQWKDPDAGLSVSEREDMFVRKALTARDENSSNFKSVLSARLENSLPDLPFRQYAKFDSGANPGTHAKSVEVFTTMTVDEFTARRQPLRVVVVNTATVRETIGLVCWLYTTEGRLPALSENMDLYDLYMEDGGEPDIDFPPLDQREQIAKFGFSRLALVRHSGPRTPKKAPSLFVTVHISTKGMTKVHVDDVSVTMREILDKVISRRVNKDTLVKGLNYNLEKYDEPGVAVDLSQPLSAMNTNEFFMVRENSARGMATDAEVVDMHTIADSLSSFQYKLYKVHASHKLLQKREFHIGVSRDQIEITQVSKSLRPGKYRTTILDTTQVAGCDLVEQKSSSSLSSSSSAKATFRLVHLSASHNVGSGSGGGVKLENQDFDCDFSLAVEITTKINSILDFFSSPVRCDYLAKTWPKGEKTSSRRKSFHSAAES